MTTFSLQPQDQPAEPTGNLLTRLWQTSRFLSASIMLFALFIPISLLGMVFVSAEIDNALIWAKPLKFSISIVFYCITLLWMLSLTTRWQKLRTTIAVVVGANLMFDGVWVIVQTVRGVRSHFNFSTAFDGAFYGLVGTSINIVMAFNVLAIILVLAQRLKNKPLQWALVFGLAATMVGGFSATFMTMPTDTQLAALEAGEQLDVIGAHSVGVADGGPGLPLLGWSTEGGDIRVPHFVGLHGLQIIPLVGVLINRLWGKRMPSKHRSGLIALAGLGYIGLTLLLLWQALRGQSVIAPDTTTLTAFAGLLATVAAIATIIVKSGSRQHPQLQTTL